MKVAYIGERSSLAGYTVNSQLIYDLAKIVFTILCCAKVNVNPKRAKFLFAYL